MSEMPRPLYNDVVIKNPITSTLMSEVDHKLKSLPKERREEFLKENLKTMWGRVEILAVGPDCRALKVGDIAMAGGTILEQAIPTPDELYLIVSERVFKAIW